MKKLLTLKRLLFLLTLFIGINAWSADYTLYFTKLTTGTNYNSYTASHTTTIDNIEWAIYGNQSVGDNVRVGGKNTTATDRTITQQQPALPIPVSKITINHSGIGNGKNSEITINSISIKFADNPSFTDATTVTTNTPDVSSAGALEFAPESGSWPANSYYQIIVNYQITGANNSYLTIDNIVFHEANGSSQPTKYNVSVANNIANGTVTASPTSATEGATVTLAATPDTGYEFGSWNVTNASTSAAITVTDNKFTMPAADVNVSATFNKIQLPSGDQTTATWIASEQGYTNGEQYTSATVDDNISLVFGDGGNDGKYYTTGSGIRVYSDGKMTVSSKNDCYITKIVVTYSDASYTGTFSANTGVYSLSSTTGTWTGSATSVVLTNTASSGHARIQKVVVTYVASTTSEEPSITAADELELTSDEAYGTFNVTWSNAKEMDVNLYTDVDCKTKFEGSWFQTELDDDNNVYYIVDANTELTPRTVYMLLYALGADGESEAIKVVTVTQATPAVTYTVTFTQPEHGTISVKHGDTDVTSGDKFAKDEQLTITATPDEGYKLSKLLINDLEFTSPQKWTMGEEDVTISATFEENTTPTPSGNTFTQVTKIDDLVVGKKYIIVNESRTMAMTSASTSSTNYRRPGSTGFSIESDYVVITNDSISQLTLMKNADNNWLFKEGNGFFDLSVSDSNYKTGVINSATEVPVNISFSDNGLVKIYNNESRVLMCSEKVQTGTNYMYFGNYSTSNTTGYQGVRLYIETSSQPSVAKPEISPNGGNFDESQEVTITAAEGCTIYYTTDGNDPTTNSTVYTAPFTITESCTVKAIAVNAEGKASAVASKEFVKNGPAPEIPEWTIAQFIENGGGKCYLTGVVSDIQNTTYGNYTLTDETGSIYIYGTLTPEGVPRQFSTLDVVAGDKIMVLAENYTLYSGTIDEAVNVIFVKKFEVEVETIHVKNIAEFKALDENAIAVFDNPVTVLYDFSQKSNNTTQTTQEYIWVEDETGRVQIFVTPSFDPTTQIAKYENGDVIPAGFTVTKHYYTNGGYHQAYSTTGEGFTNATSKALAEPAMLNFSTFTSLTDNDVEEWSDRYILMKNVSFTKDEKDGLGRTYSISCNGVTTDASKYMLYNKYDDQNAKKKDGTSATVDVDNLDASKTYNVYGICQIYSGKWEIMPLVFEEYKPESLTLKELVTKGNAGETSTSTDYTISNDLQAVAAVDNILFLKDASGSAVNLQTKGANQKDYTLFAESYFTGTTPSFDTKNTKSQSEYDQSNWLELVLPQTVNASTYVNKIVTGGSIVGRYTDALNPKMALNENTELAIKGNAAEYYRNPMSPANFNGSQNGYFFVQPQPNEYVQVVYAVYKDGYFYMPTVAAGNTKELAGKVGIGSYSYNEIGTPALNNGSAYQFRAIIKKKPTTDASSSRRKITNAIFDILNCDTEAAFSIYPLDLAHIDGIVTGIDDITVNSAVKAYKTIENGQVIIVRGDQRFNIMGQPVR